MHLYTVPRWLTHRHASPHRLQSSNNYRGSACQLSLCILKPGKTLDDITHVVVAGFPAKLPRGQRVQRVDPSSENVPRGHWRQIFCPFWGWNHPEGQSLVRIRQKQGVMMIIVNVSTRDLRCQDSTPPFPRSNTILTLPRSSPSHPSLCTTHRSYQAG